MIEDLLGVGIAIVGTTVLGLRSLWVANEAREDLAKINARLNDAIRSINTRFAMQRDHINAIEKEMADDTGGSGPESNEPPVSSVGPYRTCAEDVAEADPPPEIAKAFISGQKVDASFLDDGESEDDPLLRFSATFVRLSKDANGKTQVWLKCDEGEPEPYTLANVILMHPGDAR